MLVAMAGLPGTGKSTLARALVEALMARGHEAYILDKDHVRAAIFPPGTVAYSREQDDLCVDVMLQVATFLLQRQPERIVVLDGRTFSHREQLETVIASAAAVPAPLHVIECRCQGATALTRLTQDHEQGTHPAKNRDADLYRRVKAQADPIVAAHHLVVNTDEPLDANVTLCLAYLAEEAQIRAAS